MISLTNEIKFVEARDDALKKVDPEINTFLANLIFLQGFLPRRHNFFVALQVCNRIILTYGNFLRPWASTLVPFSFVSAPRWLQWEPKNYRYNKTEILKYEKLNSRFDHHFPDHFLHDHFGISDSTWSCHWYDSDWIYCWSIRDPNYGHGTATRFGWRNITLHHVLRGFGKRKVGKDGHGRTCWLFFLEFGILNHGWIRSCR